MSQNEPTFEQRRAARMVGDEMREAGYEWTRDDEYAWLDWLLQTEDEIAALGQPPYEPPAA